MSSSVVLLVAGFSSQPAELIGFGGRNPIDCAVHDKNLTVESTFVALDSSEDSSALAYCLKQRDCTGATPFLAAMQNADLS